VVSRYILYGIACVVKRRWLPSTRCDVLRYVICVFKRHDSWCKRDSDFPRGISPFIFAFFLPDTLKTPAGVFSRRTKTNLDLLYRYPSTADASPLSRTHPRYFYYSSVNTVFYFYYSYCFLFFHILSEVLISQIKTGNERLMCGMKGDNWNTWALNNYYIYLILCH